MKRWKSLITQPFLSTRRLLARVLGGKGPRFLQRFDARFTAACGRTRRLGSTNLPTGRDKRRQVSLPRQPPLSPTSPRTWPGLRPQLNSLRRGMRLPTARRSRLPVIQHQKFVFHESPPSHHRFRRRSYLSDGVGKPSEPRKNRCPPIWLLVDHLTVPTKPEMLTLIAPQDPCPAWTTP